MSGRSRSARADAECGEQHQDQGGDGEDAVDDDDGKREVPLRGHDRASGQRRARSGDGAVHGEPAGRHDQTEDRDRAERAYRGPGQPFLPQQEVADPQHEAAQAQEGVQGYHRHGQAGRGRGLELRIVFDDPDNEQDEASRNSGYPGEQSDNAHANYPPGAPLLDRTSVTTWLPSLWVKRVNTSFIRTRTISNG